MSEKKLLPLPPTLNARLQRAAARHNEDATEIIRRGLITELDRLESQGAAESQRMEKMKALHARGIDLDGLLDRMLREAIEPELPLTPTPQHPALV